MHVLVVKRITKASSFSFCIFKQEEEYNGSNCTNLSSASDRASVQYLIIEIYFEIQTLLLPMNNLTFTTQLWHRKNRHINVTNVH